MWGQEGQSNQSPILAFVFEGLGSSSLTSTRRAEAKHTSSKSATHLIWDSILASVSLLKSQPRTPQRAAKSDCDKDAAFRNRLTAGPTMLRGFGLVRSEFRT